MNSFVYRDGYLFAEEVSLATIAERFGTPCYVYSRSMIEDRWHAFDGAFGGVTIGCVIRSKLTPILRF